MNIKELLSSGHYVIVLDTNVILNLYRFSPEFSEFALECFRAEKDAVNLSDYVYLPYTVMVEYRSNFRGLYNKVKRNVDDIDKSVRKYVKNSQAKVTEAYKLLERSQFPGAEEIKDMIDKRFSELDDDIDGFFEEKSYSLDAIAGTWDIDKVLMLVMEWHRNRQIMPGFKQWKLYDICREGEERHKKSIPPGFMDAKKKDGIRKYSDLIIWKELMDFADTNRKNVIFVTDDVKCDWWKTSESGRIFHPDLIEEFKKSTRDNSGKSMELFPLTSVQFYDQVSNSFGIQRTDAVVRALDLTDESYCNAISDRISEELDDTFTYDYESLIDMDSSHIGSMGLDELTITSIDYVKAVRDDIDEDNVYYSFSFNVTAEGTSYEYWGKDEDTQAPVRSPGIEHVFEGNITVSVTRPCYPYLDFYNNDEYENIEIVNGTLRETDYTDKMFEEHYEELAGAYNTCPHCGRPINFWNDAGNGFCMECTSMVDI